MVPHEERPRPSFLPPAEDPTLPGYDTLEEETTSGYGEIAAHRAGRRASARTRVMAPNPGGRRFPWGTEPIHETIAHEVADDHPEAASVRGEYRIEVTLPGSDAGLGEPVTFRSDRENFHYTGTRRLLKDGAHVREKTWGDKIPRDHQ